MTERFLSLSAWASLLSRETKAHDVLYNDSGSLSKEFIDQQHLQQASTEVPVSRDQLLADLQSRGYTSEFVSEAYRFRQGAYNEQELHHHQQKSHPYLPIRGFSLESILLRESGWYPHPKTRAPLYYPPCQYGSRCTAFARHDRIPGLSESGGGIVLSSSIGEEEWKAILKDESKEARCITTKRSPCVLCSRYIVGNAIIKDNRKRNLAGAESELIQPSSSSKGTPFDFDLQQPLQSYRNLPNQLDGYNNEEMLMPLTSDLVLQPIVRCSLALLTVETIEDLNGNPKKRLNQDALQYKPSQETRSQIGENGIDYLNRVS